MILYLQTSALCKTKHAIWRVKTEFQHTGRPAPKMAKRRFLKVIYPYITIEKHLFSIYHCHKTRSGSLTAVSDSANFDNLCRRLPTDLFWTIIKYNVRVNQSTSIRKKQHDRKKLSKKVSKKINKKLLRFAKKHYLCTRNYITINQYIIINQLFYHN